MRYRKYLSKLILIILAAVFTLTWESVCFPTLIPRVENQDIYYFEKVAQNNIHSQINPQNLLYRAQKLYRQQNFLEAISILEKAAQIFQSQNNLIKQSIALSNIASAYKNIGNYQQALNYIMQSRHILENHTNINNSQDNLQIFAQVLDIQANLNFILGKPELALENWQQATAIYKRGNYNYETNRSLINQNLALQALGSYSRAIKILEELVPELNKQPSSILQVTALRSFGNAQLYLGEIDVALKTLQQSYKIAQEIKSNSQISQSLLSLGNAQRAKANKLQTTLQNTTLFTKKTPLVYINQPISPEVNKIYQQAVQTYENAIAISTSASIQIKAQLNKLAVLIELEEFSQAEILTSQIQLNLNKLPLSETSIKAQINFAQNLLSLKQVSPNNAPAWEDIAKILAIGIKQADAIENTRLKAHGMGTLGSIYLQTQNLVDAEKLTKEAVDLALQIEAKDIAYLWQWQLGYILKNQKKIVEAIDLLSQAVDNLNDLRGDLLVLNPDIQFSFRDNVEPVYRELVSLLLEKPSSQKINQNKSIAAQISQTNFRKARDVIEALQLREIENYFREICLQAKPEIVDTVIDKLDTRAAVIYPIILQNRLEIILKLPNQDKFNNYTTFVKANKLEKTIEKLEYSLKQPEKINQVKQISGDIYNWLIKPLEADLQTNKIDTLVFVLDGKLRNIPMSVLYHNQAFLIEKYAIVLTPGLQMLEPKPLQTKELNILMAGISEKLFVENQEFSPLNNVQLELRTIQSQIPKSKKLLNQSFTDINLEKQIDSAKYNIVHIATHGNFSSDLEKTYILTWNKLLKVEDFDKLFQINGNTDTRTIELLVLSACETASGDKRATLGLSGIAVRAGTRSTLASLWAVEDESTAKLMSQFYQELQQNKLNKAKALQKAQIGLLRNSEIPLIWAPYILIGNWL